MHEDSYNTMKRLVGEHADGCTTVLDVGSYDVNGTYRDIFLPPWKYTGCDVSSGPNVDLVMENEYSVPAPEQAFDLVICGNTLEHIRNPFIAMQEMARLTSKLLIIGAPFIHPEHRYPLDCWRFLPDGMRELARHVRFQCVDAFRYNNDTYLVARR